MKKSTERTARSKTLRRDQTEAELLLWKALRRKQIGGAKFRRQVPIGAYVADFFCPEKKLIIEVDGGHHGEDPQAVEDRERTAWLGREGYTVVRFWNNEVQGNLEGVVQRIGEIIAGRSPLP